MAIFETDRTAQEAYNLLVETTEVRRKGGAPLDEGSGSAL
jgi:hypothetical protein